MSNPYFTDYAEYLSRFFPGRKVQKISVNSGGTCPNRDGTLGYGGCIYCNNHSFTPDYCFNESSIVSQIDSGKKFFSKKYKDMDFLVYFQSYTTTYQNNTEKFKKLLFELSEIERIAGFVIGTRPDCLAPEMIEALAEVNKKCPIFVEIGVESMHDDTLQRINRGHTSLQTFDTIRRLVDKSLHVGVHLIAGLPGEDKDKVLQSVKLLCGSGIESIKMHQLQILRDTTLLKLIESGKIEVNPWTFDDYIDFCIELIKIVPENICIERFLASAPPEMVITPKWGLKNYEFTNLLFNKLKENEN